MSNPKMSNPTEETKTQRTISSIDGMVFAALIVVAVGCRFWIETPNFKPIAAFALFGGFFFRKPAMAIAGLLIVLTVTDFRLGYYPWQLMVCVYISLAFSAMLGLWIRRRLGSANVSLGHWAGFMGASIGMSALFYLLTNGAVWCGGNWYPATLDGLASCYAAGLPFYRMTLMGDLFFSFLTLGSYATVLYVLRGQAGAKKQATQMLGNN